MDILFSVIIPTYNRAELIGKTLLSFQLQQHSRFEVIVVDDGGNDHTRQVVESMADPRFTYHYKTNGERGAARNYGAAIARGQYLTFFDSDDLVYPWYLSNAAENIKQLANPACFAQAFDFLNEYPELDKLVKPLHSAVSGTVNKKLILANDLACNGVFVRKDIFDTFRFSENRDLSGSEDWLLWLQIGAVHPIYFSPVASSCMILHDQRGEYNIVPDKLKKRADLLVEAAGRDIYLKKYSNADYRKLKAIIYRFCALKMSDFTKLKKFSFIRLLQAIRIHPVILLYKSTYVTIKKMITSWH